MGGTIARFIKSLAFICLLLLSTVPILLQTGKGNGSPDLTVDDWEIFLYEDYPWPPNFWITLPTVKIAAEIHNKGEQAAENFVVTFFLDTNFDQSMNPNETIESETVAQLPSSNSTTVEVEWSDHPYDIGAFQICVIVNPLSQSRIAESDYNNNLACHVFEIRGNEVDYSPAISASVNLGLNTYIVYYGNPQSFPSPDTYYLPENDTVTFLIFVRNEGTVAPLNDSTISVFIDSAQGDALHLSNVKPVVPSEPRYPWECPNGIPKWSIACPFLTSPGYLYKLNWTAEHPTTYYFKISVDCFDNVQETNESNNELTFKIVVQRMPATPPEEEQKENWNPVIAACLALLLGVQGYFYMLKGRSGSALSKARGYLIVVVPFVTMEVILAVSSMFFEKLYVPPLAGNGLLLDLIVFNSGLATLVFWNHRELSQPRQ